MEPRPAADLDQVLNQELAALEQQVSECHAVHGSEISFYWCFPFWVLAAQLQLQGIDLAGLSDFEAARRIPQLIVLVDLPMQRSSLHRLISRSGVPLVLLVAETPGAPGPALLRQFAFLCGGTQLQPQARFPLPATAELQSAVSLQPRLATRATHCCHPLSAQSPAPMWAMLTAVVGAATINTSLVGVVGLCYGNTSRGGACPWWPPGGMSAMALMEFVLRGSWRPVARLVLAFCSAVMAGARAGVVG